MSLPTPRNSASPSQADAFVPRLALFWAMLFVSLGIYQPFFPVWLESRGLSTSEIGIILAAPMVVRLLTVPWTTGLADRSGRLDRALVAGCAASGVGMVGLGLVDGFWPILLLGGLIAVAWGPTVPITDAYAVAGLGRRGRAYGPVRLWGSVAFTLAGFAAGAALDRLPTETIVWMIAGSFAFAVAAGFFLLPERRAGTAIASGPLSDLLTRPMVAVFLAAACVQASHALLYGFGSLHWAGQGYSKTAVGLLWSVGVVSEILLFAVSARLSARVQPLLLIAVGGLAAILRFAVMTTDPAGPLLVTLQVLHAATFGATHLGLVAYVGAAAPPGRQAQAQGLASTAGVAVMALAMAASGPLYGAVGAQGFWVMSGLAGLGLICLAAARGRSG
jgi:PPP family 3-phenylpropionic acid transporter